MLNLQCQKLLFFIIYQIYWILVNYNKQIIVKRAVLKNTPLKIKTLRVFFSKTILMINKLLKYYLLPWFGVRTKSYFSILSPLHLLAHWLILSYTSFMSGCSGTSLKERHSIGFAIIAMKSRWCERRVISALLYWKNS